MFLFINGYTYTHHLYVTTCTQETEKARQYDRQLKQMKAERDKAEKVLMEQLESYGGEDNEESERSRQLIRNFQKKVNKSVKDDGRKQAPKTKKTKSRPKRVKKTTKKKTPATSKDSSDDEATETEPEPSEVDLDEVVEAVLESDNEEVQAEVESDNEEVQAEVESDNEEEAESDADKITIKNHRFVKGVCWVNTKFADEDGLTAVEVWWLWYEFKNQLREYIKRRRLKGNAWNEPNANHATKIVAVLGHRAEQELHILWNNGYHEWAAERIVLADKKSFLTDDLLDAYWQRQKPVKKSKIKKSKKK
jgi:hypothetical protein